jgi:hypothetical protein
VQVRRALVPLLSSDEPPQDAEQAKNVARAGACRRSRARTPSHVEAQRRCPRRGTVYLAASLCGSKPSTTAPETWEGEMTPPLDSSSWTGWLRLCSTKALTQRPFCWLVPVVALVAMTFALFPHTGLALSLTHVVGYLVTVAVIPVALRALSWGVGWCVRGLATDVHSTRSHVTNLRIVPDDRPDDREEPSSGRSPPDVTAPQRSMEGAMPRSMERLASASDAVTVGLACGSELVDEAERVRTG